MTTPNGPYAVPIEELERRMRPGELSQVGFLGPDERLEDVLDRDRQTLAELGLTPAELAAPLDALLDAAESSGRRRARLGDHDVQIELTTGFQICPWAPDPHHGQCSAGGGARHASITWQIRNRRTGERLRGPGLIVHLIRDHGFFEGRGSPFRVEPEDLARLLGLR
jgi:hypothetical protein